MNTLLTPELQAKIIAILKEISIPEDSVKITEDKSNIHIFISDGLQVDTLTLNKLATLISSNPYYTVRTIRHRKLIFFSTSLLRISIYK